MSYDAYAYLRGLVEEDQARLERDYRTTFSFIKSGPAKQYAHRVFSERYAEMERMKKQLLDVSKESHRDNPNEEMRKFWEV